MDDRGKRGEEGNTKILISWKQKELFRGNKKTFFTVFEGLPFGEKYKFDKK